MLKVWFGDWIVKKFVYRDYEVMFIVVVIFLWGSEYYVNDILRFFLFNVKK